MKNAKTNAFPKSIPHSFQSQDPPKSEEGAAFRGRLLPRRPLLAVLQASVLMGLYDCL